MFKIELQTKDIRSTSPDDALTLQDMLGNHNEDIRDLYDLISELEDRLYYEQDTSIKVGDKVMLKKDMTKVYEVESINSDMKKLMDMCMIGKYYEEQPTKYSCSNNRVYTEDQILPYNEGQYILAQEIKKLK